MGIWRVKLSDAAERLSEQSKGRDWFRVERFYISSRATYFANAIMLHATVHVREKYGKRRKFYIRPQSMFAATDGGETVASYYGDATVTRIGLWYARNRIESTMRSIPEGERLRMPAAIWFEIRKRILLWLVKFADDAFLLLPEVPDPSPPRHDRDSANDLPDSFEAEMIMRSGTLESADERKRILELEGITVPPGMIYEWYNLKLRPASDVQPVPTRRHPELPSDISGHVSYMGLTLVERVAVPPSESSDTTESNASAFALKPYRELKDPFGQQGKP